MDQLADLLITSLDLVEVQSRRIVQHWLDAARAAWLSLAFLALCTIGVAFALAAVFLFLEGPLGAATAALLTGFVACCVGVVGLLVVRRPSP